MKWSSLVTKRNLNDAENCVAVELAVGVDISVVNELDCLSNVVKLKRRVVRFFCVILDVVVLLLDAGNE